jgi:hypothetical protein
MALNTRRREVAKPLSYFGFADAEGDGLAGAVGAAGADADGFAAGLVDAPGAAAPGATVATGSGALMLSSSTSKVRVALGPMSWPAPRSP